MTECRMRIHRHRLGLRDLSEADIPHVLQYWYRSDPAYLASLAVDIAKLPPEQTMEQAIRKSCARNRQVQPSRMTALTVTLDSVPIGVHMLNHFTPSEGAALFHAHLWSTELRGCGVAIVTCPLACQIFFDRFQLSRILFHVPIVNAAMCGLLSKLGVGYVGEALGGVGVMRDKTRVAIFRLLKDELAQMMEASRRYSAAMT
jgi:RimJ/RimL family protein N-acetyltransferase